jgi:YggT family protein
MMLQNALIFLIETFAGLFTIALLVRFYIQWARAPLRNPVSDFVNALTNFAVLPARRFIPGLWGLDLATLLAAWLVQFLELFLVLMLSGYPVRADPGQAIAAMTLLAVVRLLRLGLYIVMAVLIVQAVLSWVNPYSSVAAVTNVLARPFLRPVQRVVPPIANVDLSPLVVIVICQLLLMLPVAYLEMLFMQLLR